MYKLTADADGGIVQARVDLKIHQCNMGDVDIFNRLGSYQSKLSLFYCLDKDQKLEFLSDFAHDNHDFMIVDFEKCQVDYLRKMPGYD